MGCHSWVFGGRLLLVFGQDPSVLGSHPLVGGLYLACCAFGMCPVLLAGWLESALIAGSDTIPAGWVLFGALINGLAVDCFHWFGRGCRAAWALHAYNDACGRKPVQIINAFSFPLFFLVRYELQENKHAPVFLKRLLFKLFTFTFTHRAADLQYYSKRFRDSRDATLRSKFAAREKEVSTTHARTWEW